MVDFTNLSQALMGNDNAAGKHVMKLGSKGLDATKSGLNELSNMAKDMATKSVPMFAAGKQKAAEMTDHAVAAAGHGMRQAAEMAHSKGRELQSKLGPSSSALLEHAKSKASEIQSRATPVLHHASGELTKMSQKVADKFESAKVDAAAKLSSASSHVQSRLGNITTSGKAATAAAASAGMAKREGNAQSSMSSQNRSDTAKRDAADNASKLASQNNEDKRLSSKAASARESGDRVSVANAHIAPGHRTPTAKAVFTKEYDRLKGEAKGNISSAVNSAKNAYAGHAAAVSSYASRVGASVGKTAATVKERVSNPLTHPSDLPSAKNKRGR